LLGGATPVGLLGIANMRAQVEAGLLTGLLVDGAERSPLFPNVPSIPEATGKNFNARSYFGLLAPRGTPRPIVAKLQHEVAQIVAQPDFRRRHLIERGLEPVASTPEAFARFIAEDRVRAVQIVKEAITARSLVARAATCSPPGTAYATSSRISVNRSGTVTITSWPVLSS
jgi:tripartite-type tricarboxylate transporter receptor subunit TctC